MSYQREFERRLNIGLIGVGSHAYRNLLPAMNYLPVRIRALCDINESLAKVTAEQYGATGYSSASDMYRCEDLDAVFLSVSPHVHPKLAAEAFGHRIHVWMEKPPAVRAAEVSQMIGQRGDRVAVVGFKKAFMPSTQKVIEVFRASKGKGVQSLLAEYPMQLPQNGEKILTERHTTNWLGNGLHPLSLLVAVGGAVESVTAIHGNNGSGVVILHHKNGAISNFHLVDGGPGYFTHERYAFYGDGYQMEIDNGSRVTLRRGIPFEYDRTTSYAPPGMDGGSIVWEPQNFLATLENKAIFTQGFYFSMRHFCDCILSGTPAAAGTLEIALNVMQAYEAALLSYGKRISLSAIG